MRVSVRKTDVTMLWFFTFTVCVKYRTHFVNKYTDEPPSFLRKRCLVVRQLGLSCVCVFAVVFVTRFVNSFIH